jgi:hypothetical protein
MVGWIAIVLFLTALALRVWFPSDVSMAEACVRPAIVMGLLWLAMPQLSELPRWMVWAVVIAGLVALWRPKALLLLVPVMAVLWLLRPRNRREAEGRRRELD